MPRLKKTHAPSTLRTYGVSFRRYCRFAIELGEQPLPIDPLIVATWLQHLVHTERRTAGAMAAALATLDHMARRSSLPPPSASPTVREAVQELRAWVRAPERRDVHEHPHEVRVRFNGRDFDLVRELAAADGCSPRTWLRKLALERATTATVIKSAK